MKGAKLAYKPVGMALGATSGMLAGVAFRRLWKLINREEEAPSPTDPERRWREVLLAAALQGAIFTLVRAVVDRAGAAATRRMTGAWPG